MGGKRKYFDLFRLVHDKIALGKPFTDAETFRDLEGSVGTHLTFCGHVIHHDCFNNYFSALIRSHFQENAYEVCLNSIDWMIRC